MVINAHGRTWKVADPILLADLETIETFSWRSFSRVAETLMSKTTRYSSDVSQVKKSEPDHGEKHRKMLETWKQGSSEGSYDWILPPPVTARNVAKPAVVYDQWIPASKFPEISGEVLTENSYFPNRIFPRKFMEYCFRNHRPGMDTLYGHDPWTRYLICFKEKRKTQHLSLLRGYDRIVYFWLLGLQSAVSSLSWAY